MKTQLAGGYATYRIYGRTHFAPYFKTVGNFTSAYCASYGPHRLASVQRDTVKKEASALRWLAEYATREGYVEEALVVPPLRRTSRGRVNRPRKIDIDVDVHEMDRIIEALPEWSRSKRVERFPIRARFIVAFDTGLRPSTLARLEAPGDDHRGARTLR